MLDGGDMIVSLFNLPECKVAGNIKIKRAFVGDKEVILQFVKEHFQKNWVYEVEHSLMQELSKCFVATDDGTVIGFAIFID